MAKLKYYDGTQWVEVESNIPNNSLTEAKMANEMKKGIVGGVESYDDALAHKAEKATNTVYAHVNYNVFASTIPFASWTGAEAPYSQAITVAGIVAGDVATVDIDLTSAADYATEQSITEEWAKIYRIVASATNTITVYATAETAVNIPISIKVVRGNG